MSTRSPDELNPYHRNPRRSEVARLRESLLVNGQYRPVVVNLGSHTGRPLEVLAGNHLLLAMRQLAFEHPDDPRWGIIHTHEIDVDDEAAARIVAVDNRSAEDGDYDQETLADLLGDLPDLAGTGYTPEDLDDLLADLAETAQTAATGTIVDREPPGEYARGGAVDEYVFTQKPLEQKLQGYVTTDSRSVILAYSGEVYVEMVEQLAELGRRYGTDTNSATVRRLVLDAVST